MSPMSKTQPESANPSDPSTDVQCIYTSVELPCEFCRSQNLSHCIKISPQKSPFISRGPENNYISLREYNFISSKITSPNRTANFPLPSALSTKYKRFENYDSSLQYAILAW